LTVPFRCLVQGTSDKPLLTETFRDVIPPPLQRRGKMGFSAPLDHWFRQGFLPLARELLLSTNSASPRYFRAASIRDLIDEHACGSWNHGERIWALLCFETWHRTYIDQADVPVGPIEVGEESEFEWAHEECPLAMSP
jgi:asparagine synthase (glutamine-hydrolysing)